MFTVGPTKFEELRDKRLPVALRKIELLGNLGKHPYTSEEADRREIIEKLQAAVDELKFRFRMQEARPSPPKPTRPARVPEGTADGGATFESEVRWALDAIRRGDTDLAEDRLKRCLSD